DDRGRPGAIRAGWNYYGDNQCRVVDVAVTAIEPRGEPRIVSPQDDPLVGAPVLLGRAVMVDLDPKGYANTQIFADLVEVGRDGVPHFSGCPGRFQCRWLTQKRNVSVRGFGGASAVFHASVPSAALDWEEVAGSPALQRFREDVE